MGLGKNSIDAQPSTVEKYFRFWLQYYCRAWDIDIFLIGTLPAPNKDLFPFLSTVVCMEYIP